MNEYVKMATYKDELADIFIAVEIESEEEANPPSGRVLNALRRAGALYEVLQVARKDFVGDDRELLPQDCMALYSSLASEKNMPLYEIFHDFAKGWFCYYPQKDGTNPFVFLEKDAFLQLYNKIIASKDGTSKIREAFGILYDPH